MKIKISKQQLLHHLKNELYVRIKRSPVHGVGLFAVRDIPKGIDPFKSLLNTEYFQFTKQELEKELPPGVFEMIDAYCAQTGDIVDIPTYAFNPIHVLHLINHSDNPNVTTIDGGENFVAIRDIKRGEELFSDFSTFHDGEEHFMRTEKI